MKQKVIQWSRVIVAASIGMIVYADIPSTFGKTHFILGKNAQQPTRFPALKKEQDSVVITPAAHVFFSPDHNVQEILLDLINHEQRSIKVAIYMFTDKKIAEALLQAKARGVAVEVVADTASLSERHGRLSDLQAGGIPVSVYKGVSNNPQQSPIMHNKFAVFACNKHMQPLVWTGSFNFTKSAHQYNQENVVLISDTRIAQQYTQHFDVLKKRCNVRMKMPATKNTTKVVRKTKRDTQQRTAYNRRRLLTIS